MNKRRVEFSFGVKYETPVEKVKKIPMIVASVIKNVKSAEVDRVHFKKFGDSALLFEVVYFIPTNNYTIYMDIRQKINVNIMKEFEKQKIEMAYPTQTVFLQKIK